MLQNILREYAFFETLEEYEKINKKDLGLLGLFLIKSF